MESYKKIDFKKSAKKFLETRSRKEQVLLLSKINKLPNGRHIKKMEGYENRYRLRVGDYRVLYEISKGTPDTKAKILILVVEIGNRGDVYK